MEENEFRASRSPSGGSWSGHVNGRHRHRWFVINTLINQKSYFVFFFIIKTFEIKKKLNEELNFDLKLIHLNPGQWFSLGKKQHNELKV